MPYNINKIEGIPISRDKRSIPKSLLLFFFVLTFVFGIDFGFTNFLKGKLKILSKFFTISVSLCGTFILSCSVFEYKKDLYWCSIVLAQYILNFVILQTSKYTLCEFIVDVTDNSLKIDKLNSEMIGCVMWIYNLSMYLTKWALILWYCLDAHTKDSDCVMFVIPFYVYSTFSHAVDFVSTVLILIYCYIYFCLQYLNNAICEDPNQLLQLKHQYFELADLYDKIKPLYNHLLIVELTCEMPKMMGCMWFMLKLIQENAGFFAYLTEGLFLMHSLIHIFCSSLVVQMVSAKVENIKVQLHKVLVHETGDKVQSITCLLVFLAKILSGGKVTELPPKIIEDEWRHKELTRVVTYISARRLHHEVGGVVPIDLRLPVAVLSVFATYMIVVVQFTHLYD